MKKCIALKFGRHNEIRMKTKQFAELVGTDEKTINDLEFKEEYWDTIPRDLVLRIKNALPDKCWKDTNIDEFIKEPPVVEVSNVVEEAPVKNNGLNEQNEKTLTLVEFIFEEMKESKKHSDFVANVGLLNRALSKY